MRSPVILLGTVDDAEKAGKDEKEAVHQTQSGMYWRIVDPDLEMSLGIVMIPAMKMTENQRRILINLCHFHPRICDGLLLLTPILRGVSRSRMKVQMWI